MARLSPSPASIPLAAELAEFDPAEMGDSWLAARLEAIADASDRAAQAAANAARYCEWLAAR